MRRHQENPHVDVTVVMPAHNEEGNIGPLFEQFGELTRSARFTFEVVLVDDGSTDRTLARAMDAQRNYRFARIVTLPYRRGLTEALRAGFAVARGRIIVFYPADRQFHPNDIPKMVEKLREGYDLVTGRKIGEYDKRVVSGLYNRISRMLFPSIPVTDLNSVKAFRRELTDVFDYRHDWHRFWVAIVCEAGYRVGEVDVTLYKRRVGKSKFGFWRIPGGVLDLLAVKFQYHTMRRPLWYFGMTGSILLAAAFGIGIWAVYQRFVMGHGYRPLLYLVMTLGITGIVFFTLGFLAESVAGIREQLQSLRGTPRFGAHQPSPAGRSPESMTPPSPVQGASRQVSESRQSSSDDRPRRTGGQERRQSHNDRRGGPPRTRRSPDRSVAGSAPEVPIRRRTLESPVPSSPPQTPSSDSPAVEAGLSVPDEGRQGGQSSRDLSSNDLFSASETTRTNEIPSESDSGSPSADDSAPSVSEPAQAPGESPIAPRDPRPFGRRNRR